MENWSSASCSRNRNTKRDSNFWSALVGLKFKIIMTITILRIYGKRMAREVDMGEIGEIEKWIRCSVRERERENTNEGKS